jgi:Alpha-tubulin suppressor and related RCC1 domain-containing proteins
MRRFVLVLAGTAFLGGCVTERIGAPAVAFTVAPKDPLLVRGMSFHLKAYFPSDDSVAAVSWSSSDNSIATVDSTGEVSALTAGTAVISARIGDTSQSTTITIARPPGTTIVSGGNLTCGVTAAFDAMCWGDNSLGQTGTQSSDGALVDPLPVVGNLKWQSLSASWNHACGVASSGDIYCWGLNASGELGNGAVSPPVQVPARVVSSNKWIAVAAGGARWFGFTDIELNDAQETCGIARDGSAYCWGVQGSTAATGELQSSTPVLVANGLHFSSISVGSAYACGISVDRRAYCWGNNDLGQLGRAPAAFDRGAKPVEGDLRFIAVSAGGVHTCGIAADSTAYCWGANDGLQLGSATAGTCIYRGASVQCQSHPVAVPGGFKFTAISAGGWPQVFDAKMGSHSCGITVANDVVCWGLNRYGQSSGYRTNDVVRSPAILDLAGIKFSAVSTGSAHTCAVTTAGVGYCWGERTISLSGNSFGPGRPTSLNGLFNLK